MVKVEYWDDTPGVIMEEIGIDGRVAIVSGLAPNEPVFVFRARDLAFSAAFAAWWEKAAPGFDQPRRDAAKAGAWAMADWAIQNPKQARLPD